MIVSKWVYMSKLSESLFFLVLCLSLQAFAEPLRLNEELLLSKASQNAPQLDQIEATFQSVKILRGEEEEKYAPELFGQAAYSETNERALIQFSPVFSPIKQAQIGVRQKLSKGFDVQASALTDQRSASSPFIGKIKDGTTTSLAFTMQMDLWKNLLGRMSEAKLESLALEKKKAEIEKEIQINTFRITLRRLYWSLVANQQSLEITEGLLKSASDQAQEIRLRFKNAVAEADEVARANAQVASREGTVTFLKYQREKYFTQLKNLLPEIASYDLQLDKVNIDKTVEAVMGCTAAIAGEAKTPYHFTRYDEAVSLLKEIKVQQNKYNSYYADPEVKLFGTVKATGVSLDEVSDSRYRGSYGGSVEDVETQNRTGYEVGVMINIPLGKEKERTERAKEIYDDKRLLASINSTDLQVKNTHQEFLRTITFLNEVIRSQKVSSSELLKRLKGMRKKYEQARVSLSDIVQDQDALLNAELSTIDTQLQILNTIFDYLVIFSETPCTFNRTNS